jgi:hypothetical protein
MANGTPAVTPRWLLVAACVGLVLFGAVVGIVAALSVASGTATTLLGLLFALIGGSLVSLFANSKLTEKDRAVLGCAVGLIALGTLLGLSAGFGLKKTEAGGGTGASTGGGSPVFVIHSTNQDKLTKVKKACKAVLDGLPENDPNRARLEEFFHYLDFLDPASAKSKLDSIDAILSGGDEKYNKDAFVSKFREFRKPDTSPKAGND